MKKLIWLLVINNLLSVLIAIPVYYWLSDYLDISNFLLFIPTVVVVLTVTNGALFLLGVLDKEHHA